MSHMIVPGSTCWTFGVGPEREEVASDEEATQNMHDLGETIAWLLKHLGKVKEEGAPPQKSFYAGS